MRHPVSMAIHLIKSHSNFLVKCDIYAPHYKEIIFAAKPASN